MFAVMRKIGPIAALVWAAWSTTARADILPDPHRPIDWDERPLPQPEPPPDKELVHALFIGAAALVLASGIHASGRRRALVPGGP